jgi:hypothetical protein
MIFKKSDLLWLVKENRSNLHSYNYETKSLISENQEVFHDSLGSSILEIFFSNNLILKTKNRNYINNFIDFILKLGYVPSNREINISKKLSMKELSIIKMKESRRRFKLFCLYVLRHKTIDDVCRNIVEFIP